MANPIPDIQNIDDISLLGKLLPLNDDLIIIAGHGPYTNIGREKSTNPFLNQQITKYNPFI